MRSGINQFLSNVYSWLDAIRVRYCRLTFVCSECNMWIYAYTLTAAHPANPPIRNPSDVDSFICELGPDVDMVLKSCNGGNLCPDIVLRPYLYKSEVSQLQFNTCDGVWCVTNCECREPPLHYIVPNLWCCIMNLSVISELYSAPK